MPELQRLRPQGIHLRESHSTSRGYAGLRLRAEPLRKRGGARMWLDVAVLGLVCGREKVVGGEGYESGVGYGVEIRDGDTRRALELPGRQTVASL